MGKNIISVLLAALLILCDVSAASPQALEPDGPPAVTAQDRPRAEGPDEAPFYSDVPEDQWYYGYVLTLWNRNALPKEETFAPLDPCTRLDLVRCLYQVHLALGGEENRAREALFSDVPPESEGFAAVLWANESGVAQGVSDREFDPHAPTTREQCCTFLLRFAALEGFQLAQRAQPAFFRDSADISDYARSSVVACQMAGVANGNPDGRFLPAAPVSRCETAAMVCRLWAYSLEELPEGTPRVSTQPGAYLSFYDNLPPRYGFGEPVGESGAVPMSWFDGAVFIGDSVTVRLQMYCSSTGALGNAAFLCSTSLSAANAQEAVSPGSKHPSYNGVKMKVEDGVAACGAKNVYIMLGINNMRAAIANSTGDLVTLISNIQRKCPEVNILVQSVTPISSASNLTGDIHNGKVDQYNQRVRELCAQYHWYYLDVASQFKDESGCLIPAYCSDPRSMGIHFTSAGAKVWVDYLYTHVPEDLK